MLIIGVELAKGDPSYQAKQRRVWSPSFDDLLDPQRRRWRDCQAKSPRRLEIENQIGLVDREIGWTAWLASGGRNSCSFKAVFQFTDVGGKGVPRLLHEGTEIVLK
jgi:hypothetical protein